MSGPETSPFNIVSSDGAFPENSFYPFENPLDSVAISFLNEKMRAALHKAQIEDYKIITEDTGLRILFKNPYDRDAFETAFEWPKHQGWLCFRFGKGNEPARRNFLTVTKTLLEQSGLEGRITIELKPPNNANGNREHENAVFLVMDSMEAYLEYWALIKSMNGDSPDNTSSAAAHTNISRESPNGKQRDDTGHFGTPGEPKPL